VKTGNFFTNNTVFLITGHASISKRRGRITFQALNVLLYKVAQNVRHYQMIKKVLNRTEACQLDSIYSSN